MLVLLENGGAGHGSLQRRALSVYLELTAQVDDWARRLVMLAAADEAAPVALAVVAAGGSVLWIDTNEASLRKSSQAGLIDFQVTNLSEALRILKNEIRKGLPVSVGVLDANADLWDEAVERGVQPHALLAGATHADAAEVLVVRGAARLQSPRPAEVRDLHAATWRERRAGDAALLARVSDLPAPHRQVAGRWLRAAPRLFPRDTVRCYAAAWDASKGKR